MRHEAKGTTGGAHLDYLITTFWISMGGVLAGLASLALGELMAGDTPIIAFAPVALWGITVLWWIIRLVYGLICLLKRLKAPSPEKKHHATNKARFRLGENK